MKIEDADASPCLEKKEEFVSFDLKSDESEKRIHKNPKESWHYDRQFKVSMHFKITTSR